VFDDVLALGWLKHMQIRDKFCGTLMQSDSRMIVLHFAICQVMFGSGLGYNLFSEWVLYCVTSLCSIWQCTIVRPITVEHT